MADPALGVVLGHLFKTVVPLAAEEIALASGVREDLKTLAQKLKTVQALLSDAQSKQFTSEAVRLWLQRLESVALDAQIVLDEFGYKVLRQKIECRKRDKVRRFFSSSNPLVHRLMIAHEIKGIMSSLEGVYAESSQIGLQQVIGSPSPIPPHLKENRKTNPSVDDSEIVGRDDDTSQVINMLVGSDYKSELPVITILGMGGQGKTALAQLVNKNDKVQCYFDKRVWVCVSDHFNVERLLAEMLKSLEQPIDPLANAQALVGKLKEQLGGKRYLLVLDDVWNENGVEWDGMRRCLKDIGGSKESKVLATTRSDVVAKTMRTSKYHWLQVLSEGQSLKLFEKWAFAEGEPKKSPEMVDIGKRILKTCGGVPLAIRVIGGLLYIQNSESEWSMIERTSKLWSGLGEGNSVTSSIKLSYDHLPSLALKQCFAYCAIFQKDRRMGKDELIQLWMAQGLLNPPKDESRLQMEDIGTEYFYILLRSSLLGDVEKDDDDNIKYCKMHDLVHDVALQVSENYCFHAKDWKDLKDEIKAVHLSIIASEGGLPKSLKDINAPSKLRTLHLGKGSYVFIDLIANSKCLTVLILEDGEMKELPNSIGKMKHLRFLDISRCWGIRRLPKWVTELYYLQTLRVPILDEVPKGFWKLINLRHFYVENMRDLPLIPRLSELRNLRSLPYFKVDKCSGCQIEELEHLDNLKGKLRIHCLQNVSTRESALKSNLSKKSGIQTLDLHWDWRRREEDCDDSDVMEGLKPHSNLKSLTICDFQSPKFPSWIKLLGNLVKLQLMWLTKCEQLPSLGHLPCLEHLEIIELESLRCIGEEWYGWSNNVDLDGVYKNNCSSNTSATQITLFPSLKCLSLYDMSNLVEWSDAIVPAAHTHSLSVQVFPVLEEMKIGGLYQLCSFPNLGCLPKLRRLELSWLNKCEQLPSLGHLPCLEHLEIIELDSVRCIGEEWYGWSNNVDLEGVYKNNCSSNASQITLFPSLKVLSLREMSNLVEWSDAIVPAAHTHSLSVQAFPVLEVIEITDLPELCSFPNLGCLRKLQRLILSWLNKCEQIPSLGHLPCLEHLEIWGLHSVGCIGEEFYGWSNNVDLDGVYKNNNCSSNASQITLFPSLKFLRLSYMSNVVEWSDAVVPAAHTHSLSVQVFPVLEEINLYDLPQLCSFPNLGCLPKLKRLTVVSCDKLTIPTDWKRLQKSESEDERAASDSCFVSSWEGPSSSSYSPSPPYHHYLPSLREVYLDICENFTASFCSLKILSPIESLSIFFSPNLWPEDLLHLINLRSLKLGGNCREKHEEVDCFPFFPYSISNVNVVGVVRGALSPEDVQYFPSLTALTLSGFGFPNVTSLSHQIQYLTLLTDFEIYGFDGLEALPEWLGNLKSLQNLRVHYCRNLKQLPSVEAFQRLINLQCLDIRGCSQLEKACTQGSGSEWPKIAHIPNLEVRSF